jgi:hypothetical protein
VADVNKRLFVGAKIASAHGGLESLQSHPQVLAFRVLNPVIFLGRFSRVGDYIHIQLFE